MNLQKRIALSLASVTLLALTAGGASAATLTRGTFTLPGQAYWNDTLLQAGDYTLSVSGSMSGVPIILLRGEGVTATFFAPAGFGQASGRSFLKLDDVNGTYVVRELDAAPLGAAYRFGVSKAARSQIMRGEARTVTVPVAGL